jgi:hypothetical protein
MRFAGQCCECFGDLVEVCANVCGCGAGVRSAVVPGEGPGDTVAETPFDPRQRGVPDPVRTDLLCCYPRQVRAKASPDLVVAPGGDRLSVAVPQQWTVSVGLGVSLLVVSDEVMHEGRRNRLPTNCLALFAKTDQALDGVEIDRAKRERPASTACRLGVKAQQECVEIGIIAGDAGCTDNLSKLLV